MRDAALSENEKSLALASIRSTVAFPEVASQMRRLFGPRGGAARQDVLVAADLDAASEEEDFARCAGYCKAKKGKGKRGEVSVAVKLGGASNRRRDAL